MSGRLSAAARGRRKWSWRVLFSDGGIAADLRTLPAQQSARGTPGAPSWPPAAAADTAEVAGPH